MWRLMLVFLTLLGLVATSSGLVNCTASVCLAPGETWAPTALNVSGRLTVVGTPDAPASTLDFNSLTATFTPGSSIHLQDLTLVAVLAAPRTSSAATFLTPASLVGPGAPLITYTNVTLQLPSNCSLLGQYTSLLCQDVVNSSLVINRWGVLFHSWSSAAVTARNLNLTCGRSLPPSFNMLCSSTSVSQPRELLAALVDTATMAASTTSFIHVLANISLQGYVPDSAAGCGVAGRLVNITNKVVIAGVPTPENPRPELDWAGWCGLASVGAPFTSLQLSNLTQANLPVGPVLQAPLRFFTAATFIVDFVRVALGFRGTRLLLQDVTLLLPADEMVWWSAMAADPSLAAAWCSPLHIFEVANVSNASILVQQLRPGRVTYEWQNTLLVSVEQQRPSSTLLVHDTGVLRLNGLGAAVFPVQSILRSGSTVGMNDLRPSPFEAPSSRRVLAMDQTTKADISTIMALQRDTVITGNPYQPQALLLDLAAAPTRLGLTLPGGQLTLSNLVLGNAAPLLSSLVCGAAAQQQGVACNPASLNSTADPEASSRAVWQATRLGVLGAEPPLTPLCSPALADALGGLTSLLWFFHSPRTSPLAQQPPLAGQPSLASAPLVLLNVTILLPDLEAQAIREVAAGGSTRVNLRPDTLELLRAQLAGQQVRPASWPPGGLVFPTFSWFGVQGLDVTLAPATATDPWGEVWKNSFNILFPQIVPSSLTTMVHPDGPLLLTPNPNPGPPPPNPNPPSQPTAPSPAPTPHPTLNDAQPHSPQGSAAPSACSGCRARTVGAAVGSAVAGLLLCAALLLLLLLRAHRDQVCSLTAVWAAHKTLAALRLCSRSPKPSFDEVTSPVLPGKAEATHGVGPVVLSGCADSSHDLQSSSVLVVMNSSMTMGPSGADHKMHGLKADQQGRHRGVEQGYPCSHLDWPFGRGKQQQQGQQQQQQQGHEACIVHSTPSSAFMLVSDTHCGKACNCHGSSSTDGAVCIANTMPDLGVEGAVDARPELAGPSPAPGVSTESTGHWVQPHVSQACSTATAADLPWAGLGQAGLEQEVKLEQQLGAGAFGTVYQGSWRGQKVAVKRLLFSGLTHQPDFRAQRQQVLMEAELNAGLAHPNLVATYAYRFAPLTHSNEVATDWVLLLVCELCSCGSLSNAIVNGRLWDSQLQQPRVPQVLTVLGDVAHGMAYLHSRNIMHRDLKPDNVLLQDSPEGVVAKVADLGLGAVLRWQQTHLSNAYAGTPLYMAPEVQQQERSSLAGDVYSFGVLAWELLHGCTVWARLQQITQEPRYLQCLVPHPNLFDHDWQPQPAGPAAAPQVEVVLRGLRELVDACLQPQPGARPSFPGLIQQLSVLSGLHGGEVQGV